MNMQSQMLFEAPFSSKAACCTNSYANQKYYRHVELEAEHEGEWQGELEAEWEAEFKGMLKNAGKWASTAALSTILALSPPKELLATLVRQATELLTGRQEEEKKKKLLDKAPKDKKDSRGVGSPPRRRRGRQNVPSWSSPPSINRRTRRFQRESEWETEPNSIWRFPPDVLMELLGHAVIEAESETQTATLIESLLPLATKMLPQVTPIFNSASPDLVRGLILVTHSLCRDPDTLPLVHTIPAIIRNTAAVINRQLVKGQPVTPQTTLRTLKHQALQVISNPQKALQALRHSNAIIQNSKLVQYSNPYSNPEYGSRWLFEAPFVSEGGQSTNSYANQEYYPEPQYGRSIPLASAPTAPDVILAKKGLYKIYKGEALVYNGSSGNLGQRLKSHRGCLTHLKVPIQDYKVRIAALPRSTVRSRKAREQVQRDKHPRALKHQRATAEAEEFLSKDYR